MYIEFMDFRQSILTQAQNVLLWMLLALIIVDFLTGTIKAIRNKEVNSSIAKEGLIKHAMVFLVNILVNVFAYLLGYGNWANLFTGAFLVTYLESLVENWGEAGLPMPDELEAIIAKLPKRNQKEKHYHVDAEVMKIEEKIKLEDEIKEDH